LFRQPKNEPENYDVGGSISSLAPIPKFVSDAAQLFPEKVPPKEVKSNRARGDPR
jgi:hypothetical protein